MTIVEIPRKKLEKVDLAKFDAVVYGESHNSVPDQEAQGEV